MVLPEHTRKAASACLLELTPGKLTRYLGFARFRSQWKGARFKHGLKIRIIGVPMDLARAAAGVDMGPSHTRADSSSA